MLQKHSALHDPAGAALHRHAVERRIACRRRHLCAVHDPRRVGIDAGILLPDEARALEGLPPLNTPPDEVTL